MRSQPSPPLPSQPPPRVWTLNIIWWTSFPASLRSDAVGDVVGEFTVAVGRMAADHQVDVGRGLDEFFPDFDSGISGGDVVAVVGDVFGVFTVGQVTVGHEDNPVIGIRFAGDELPDPAENLVAGMELRRDDGEFAPVGVVELERRIFERRPAVPVGEGRDAASAPGGLRSIGK